MKVKKLYLFSASLLLALVLMLISSPSFADGKTWDQSFKIGKSESTDYAGKETCKQIWNTDGKIVQQGDDLYLYGGAWTGGQLVNGRKDGNAVRSNFVHVLKNHRFDMTYTVYGNDYCEFGCGLARMDTSWEDFYDYQKGFNTRIVSTGRSENGSSLVPSGTKIYVSFLFNERSNSVTQAVSTGGFYDEEGANILFIFPDFPYDICIKTFFDNHDFADMAFYLNNNEGGANSYMVINDIEVTLIEPTEEELRIEAEEKQKKKKEHDKNKIIVSYELEIFKNKDKETQNDNEEEIVNNNEEISNNNTNNSNNPDNQYPDFALDTADSWAIDGINSAKDNGLYTIGMMEQDFKGFATREEFTEMVWLLYENMGGTVSGNENPFIDTTNETIIKAYNADIISGVSENRFAPNDLLTREQFCTIVLRMLNKLGVNYESDLEFQKEYADLDQISDWAYDSVRIMNAYKIISGYNELLMPKDNLTREQAVIMLNHIYTKFYSDDKQSEL